MLPIATIFREQNFFLNQRTYSASKEGAKILQNFDDTGQEKSYFEVFSSTKCHHFYVGKIAPKQLSPNHIFSAFAPLNYLVLAQLSSVSPIEKIISVFEGCAVFV